MQGREAKHQRLANYANFALPKERWEKVFMHEHMSLIWLRQQNPCLIKYDKSKDSYIPNWCTLDRFVIVVWHSVHKMVNAHTVTLC